MILGQVTTPIVLERVQVAAREVVARNVLASARLTEMVDSIANHLVYTLDSYVLADHLAPASRTFDYTTETWASWWQHTKAAAFPTYSRWLRRPPRTTVTRHSLTVEVQNWATFPEATVVYPPEFGRPRMLQTTSFVEADE